MFIKRLPFWNKVDKFPAFFDSESLTATQQTARVYGKINELIDKYNEMVTKLNTEIESFETGVNTDISEFRDNVTKIITDYMYKIDTQIVHQDRMIEEVYDKFKNRMEETVADLFQEMQDAGELEVVIENAVAEFIESLKTSLKAEVTAEVESTMAESLARAQEDINTVVANGKSTINNAVVDGKNQIAESVDNGVERVDLALDEGINNYIGKNNLARCPVIMPGESIFAMDMVPGIHHTSTVNEDGAMYGGSYSVFGYGVQGGEPESLLEIPAGSTIIHSHTVYENNPYGYQTIIYCNDVYGTVHILSGSTQGTPTRIMTTTLVDPAAEMYTITGDPKAYGAWDPQIFNVTFDEVQVPALHGCADTTIYEGQTFTFVNTTGVQVMIRNGDDASGYIDHVCSVGSTLSLANVYGHIIVTK